MDVRTLFSTLILTNTLDIIATDAVLDTGVTDANPLEHRKDQRRGLQGMVRIRALLLALIGLVVFIAQKVRRRSEFLLPERIKAAIAKAKCA